MWYVKSKEFFKTCQRDTSGNYDMSLRPLCYANASLFIICFSLVTRDSFLNVLHRWIPEITSFVVGVPVLLVGKQLTLLKIYLIIKEPKKT
jgi:GTPase SAR1 family protein